MCVFLSGTPADSSDIPAWVEQKGGTLHFTTVTRADAGNYTCLASNSQQGEIRAVVQLTVAGIGENKDKIQCWSKLNHGFVFIENIH